MTWQRAVVLLRNDLMQSLALALPLRGISGGGRPPRRAVRERDVPRPKGRPVGPPSDLRQLSAHRESTRVVQPLANAPQHLERAQPEPPPPAGLDELLSFAVISPLVATFWRGSWVLADFILPKENEATAGCVSLLLGTSLVLLLHTLRLHQPRFKLSISEQLTERLFRCG